MLFKPLLVTGLFFWNTAIIIAFFLFIFFALGKVFQKRFDINPLSFTISIPLGFIIFLLLTFIFLIPTMLLRWTLNLNFFIIMENIFIFAIIFIYYDSWWPFSFENKKRIFIPGYSFIFSFFLFFIFILLMVYANLLLPNFNHLTYFHIRKISDTSTSVKFGNYLLNILNVGVSGKEYLTLEIYYKWLLFILAIVILYFTSIYWMRQLTNFTFFSSFFGFLMALFLSSYFLFLNTQSLLLIEFLIFLVSLSLVKNFYTNWSKEENIMIMFYYSLFVIFTFLPYGVVIFLVFFVSISLIQMQQTNKSKKIIINGVFLLLVQINLLIFFISQPISLITFFLSMIFFIPTISKYNNVEKQKNEIIKEREKNEEIENFKNNPVSNSKAISITITFFIIFLSNVIVFVTKDFSFNDYIGWYFNIIYNKTFTINLYIYFIVFFFPFLLLLVFYLVRSKVKWFSAFGIAYLLFLNPFSYIIIWKLFPKDNFAYLYLFLPLLYIEIIWWAISSRFQKVTISLKNSNREKRAFRRKQQKVRNNKNEH